MITARFQKTQIMSKFLGQSEFRHGEREKIGVLLVNLGTPNAPSIPAIRTYLAEFLSDRRVVELPRWLWLPILHLVILRLRPRRAAHAYAKVWTADGSPLLQYSRQLTIALSKMMGDSPQPLQFELAMRYGEPAISATLERMTEDGCRRIVVLPMYPQYASATTGSVHDAIARFITGLRWVPEIRVINNYHKEPNYISALAKSVRDFWQEHGRGERLLMSFHGIPKDTFLAGDPYFCQCQATARLLATELQLGDDDWSVSFQSRVGPKQWLEPYTEQTLIEWGGEKLEQVDVICPGFAVDCLETLEEIAMQNADFFRDAGGGNLRYIPALNARPEHCEFLSDLLSREMQTWNELSSSEPNKAPERARALGAIR